MSADWSTKRHPPDSFSSHDHRHPCDEAKSELVVLVAASTLQDSETVASSGYGGVLGTMIMLVTADVGDHGDQKKTHDDGQ